MVIINKTITTTNSYYGDYHKLPCLLITSEGTLLVAIEQLPGNYNHGSAIQIFRFANPLDLSDYTSTTVGNTSTQRLSYNFLFEVNGNVVIEARRYTTTQSSPNRSFAISTDDGQTFGAVSDYISLNTNWVAYTKQVLNNAPNDDYVYISLTPAYVPYGEVTIYKIGAIFKTDFVNFYKLDGTNIGTTISQAEAESASIFGAIPTSTNSDYFVTTTPKIMGDYIWALGFKGTRVDSTITLTAMQIIRVTLSNGDVTLGAEQPPVFGNTPPHYCVFYNVCGKIGVKMSFNNTMYYYWVYGDINGLKLISSETGDFHNGLLSDIYSELNADYDIVSKKLRVFRFSSAAEAILSDYEAGIMEENITLTLSTQGTLTDGSSLIDTTTGLISCWEFDETTGTTAYDELGNNNAIINGAIIIQTGLMNKAIEFDLSNDY